MPEHEPDHKDLCRACGQVWPCRVAKLRAMANQTTSPHEAEVAKAKLRAMGESHERPIRIFFGHSRPAPKPSQQTYASYVSYDDLLREIQRLSAEELHKMAEAIFRTRRPFQSFDEQLRKAREETERRQEASDQVRRARAATTCPGCDHRYNDHIGSRCYACHPNAKIEASERRAAWCGWFPIESTNNYGIYSIHWAKIQTNWRGGPQFDEIIYDEWKKEDADAP